MFLRRALLAPLRALIEADEGVGRGGDNGVLPAEVIPENDLGRVMESRNEMLRRLDEQSERLRQEARVLLVSWEAMREILGPLAAFAGEEEIQRGLEALARVVRKSPSERTRVDLNALVRELVELRAYEMRVNNIEVRCWLDEALPQTSADRQQLQQAVLNLIINAEQAMAGRGGTLTVHTERIGERLRLTVADTGLGIPPAHLPEIFDPFFTTKEVGQGTGLGDRRHHPGPRRADLSRERPGAGGDLHRGAPPRGGGAGRAGHAASRATTPRDGPTDSRGRRRGGGGSGGRSTSFWSGRAWRSMTPVDAAVIRRKLAHIAAPLDGLRPLGRLSLDEYRARFYERRRPSGCSRRPSRRRWTSTPT